MLYKKPLAVNTPSYQDLFILPPQSRVFQIEKESFNEISSKLKTENYKIVSWNDFAKILKLNRKIEANNPSPPENLPPESNRLWKKSNAANVNEENMGKNTNNLGRKRDRQSSPKIGNPFSKAEERRKRRIEKNNYYKQKGLEFLMKLGIDPNEIEWLSYEKTRDWLNYMKERLELKSDIKKKVKNPLSFQQRRMATFEKIRQLTPVQCIELHQTLWPGTIVDKQINFYATDIKSTNISKINKLLNVFIEYNKQNPVEPPRVERENNEEEKKKNDAEGKEKDAERKEKDSEGKEKEEKKDKTEKKQCSDLNIEETMRAIEDDNDISESLDDDSPNNLSSDYDRCDSISSISLPEWTIESPHLSIFNPNAENPSSICLSTISNFDDANN